MKKRAVFLLCAGLVLSAFSLPLKAAEPNFPLKGNRVFEPLPAGAVKPTGWLRDWAISARDGYTGVMDEVDPEFVRAWTADFSPTCPVGDWGNGSWSYEGGGYWFDGLVRLAYQLDDENLLTMVQKRLAPVLENHRLESIGHFYWLDRKNADDVKSVHPDYGWGLWASGLYGRAMTEYFEASGDPDALEAMQCSDDSHDYRCITLTGLGSPPNNAWNACMDYAKSGNENVGETLTRFYDKKDVDWPSLWEPYRSKPNEKLWRGEQYYPKDWVMRFHGVFFNEAIAGWAAGTLWTGRPEFLETALAWQKLMDERCLQPYGAMVEDELYGPTGAYRATETCTLAAELWRRVMLVTMTGDGAAADKTERLFFNAGAGMTTRDFTRHVYHQQPNRINAKSFIYSWGDKSKCTFQRKHYPLCCTAGLNRIIPTYTQYLWMKTADGGLAATLYAPNTLRTTVGETPVQIDSATDYPFGETISMTVTPEKSAAFPLSLRIPAWCEDASVSLNGEKLNAKADENGFVKIERTWSANDKITLDFPMTPTVERGVDRNAKKVPRPEGTWGEGVILGEFADAELSAVPYADVAFGPLLFVLPIPEADENTPAEGGKWQYALDPARVLENVEIVRRPMPERWGWQLDSPIALRVAARAAEWSHDEEFPHLPTAEEMKLGADERITLIPYGCAKLRVSMFPVVPSPQNK